MTDASPGTKRLRISLPEQNTDALQIIERRSPIASNDLIEYFADRGTQALQLQRENSDNQGNIARLQNSLITAERELNALKASILQKKLGC